MARQDSARRKNRYHRQYDVTTRREVSISREMSIRREVSRRGRITARREER